MAAFLFGAVAHRLRLPALVGYLLAGILLGPFTPGFVADQELANQFAEVGVILLMFGVGLHFSIRQLVEVRRIAVPGALAQIGVSTLLGFGLARWLGWSTLGGLVFGLALSVASTVVLLRALEERRILDTERGRIAVGWLIVEDLAMVLALVLIPALAAGAQGGASASSLGAALGLTMLKVAGFVALMLVVGKRFVPWLLHIVAHTGSRELFRLAVLATALGVAFGAAMLFGVSFALGAFFAGTILAESPLSQRAAEETLPLRDAFAVLFFVSVGMLFNPRVLVEDPLPVLATAAIIMLGKSVAAYAIVRVFGRSRSTALTISASLAQIGEFSFILASLAVSLELLPPAGRDLILAGAIVSIVLNPLLFALIDRVGSQLVPGGAPIGGQPAPPMNGHVVVVGFGRVGARVVRGLAGCDESVTLIELEPARVAVEDREKITLVQGNAVRPEILAQADLENARMLFVATPEPFEAGHIVEQARAINPAIHIVARAHRDEEVDHLQKLGATSTIMGEDEIARKMIDEALIGTR